MVARKCLPSFYVMIKTNEGIKMTRKYNMCSKEERADIVKQVFLNASATLTTADPSAS